MKMTALHYKALLITYLFVAGSYCQDNNPAVALDAIIQRGIQVLDSAYNNWDERLFQESAEIFSTATELKAKGGLAEYWEGAAMFFLAIYHLFSLDKQANIKQGRSHINRGIEVLTESIRKNPNFSESYALRAVLRGMKIKMKPMSAFAEGPKIGKDRKKAIELDPGNPRVQYLIAVSFWHSPKILGDYGKALPHFLKADTLFRKESLKDKNPLLPTWGHSTSLAFTGEAYLAENDFKNASVFFDAALRVNPRDPLAKLGLGKLAKSKEK